MRDIQCSIDYYAGGSLMPGRNFNSNEYRYGFNGKENDNEVKGTGNQQDYGFRIYDPRIAKFLSVDPLTKSFPYYTPYQFAGNKPIWAIDLDGKEEYFVTDYYNAAGNLYMTRISIISDNGMNENKQIVHRAIVAVDNVGNTTFTAYIGSNVGNTSGNNNAFANNIERGLATGTSFDGLGNQSPITNYPTAIPMTATDGTTFVATSETTYPTPQHKYMDVEKKGHLMNLKKTYFDANGNAATDPRENGVKEIKIDSTVDPTRYTANGPPAYEDPRSIIPLERGTRCSDPNNTSDINSDIPRISNTDLSDSDN